MVKSGGVVSAVVGLPESNVASQAVSAADACPSTFFCRSAMQTAARPDGLAHKSEFYYDAGGILLAGAGPGAPSRRADRNVAPAFTM